MPCQPCRSEPTASPASDTGKACDGLHAVRPGDLDEPIDSTLGKGVISDQRSIMSNPQECRAMATATRRMRKIINEPDQVVKESLAGLAASVPDILRYDVENQILVRAGAPVKGKVALISGGGSGHEPLHGGFVGVGMLDAACPGEVFTSPVPDQMLAATKAVDGGAGVIHIVKNYTGDVLNFKMAADEAEEDGIKVEAIVIDDDVAVQDSLYTAGRR